MDTHRMAMTDEYMVNGTAEDFMRWFAMESDTTVEKLRQAGRVPRYVSKCPLFEEPHWEMGHVDDAPWRMVAEVAAPE